MYGLAIDIGTTNIAAALVDLNDKKIVMTVDLPNSQGRYGQDVMTRLHLSYKSNLSKRMHELLIGDLNRIISKLNGKRKDVVSCIGKVFVSANTVMLHFLYGLDASGLMAAPFRSNISSAISMSSKKLGILFPKNISICSLQPVSPFVGGDLVAGLLSVGMDTKHNQLYLDLGTNAEIAVSSKRGIFAASAAAGPAFRSKRIPLGSDTIKNAAILLRKGILEGSGRLKKKARLDQNDIRSLQVAKGAIRAAIHILLHKAGVDINDVKNTYIAGVFGERIRVEDAIEVGLIPRLQRATVEFVGDAALEGTVKLMLSKRTPASLNKYSKLIKLVDLNKEKSFQDLYLNAMKFSS